MKPGILQSSFRVPMRSPKGKKVDLDFLASCALNDRRVTYNERNASSTFVLTETHSLLLCDIHKFAKTLIANDRPLFELHEKFDIGTVLPTEQGSTLISLLDSSLGIITETYPIHVFSPVISVFLRYARDFQPGDVCALRLGVNIGEARELHKYLSQLVEDFRSELRKKEIARATSDFRRSPAKNFNNCIESLTALADECSDCTSLRFDIHYKPHPRNLPPKPRNQILQELREVRPLRRTFHRKMRAKFGADIGGWMCCLEYGAQRGWHYHYLVLLKGSHLNSIDLIDDLRAEWSSITDDMGSSDNVNKRTHRFTGTGVINFGYSNAVIGLQFIAAYFILGNCFVQLDLSPEELKSLGVKGIRSFIMGDFPEVKPIHRNKGKGVLAGLKIRFFDALNRVQFL